ncbi:MAG: potassium transporter TrkG [Elusimicrobiota bacterium]
MRKKTLKTKDLDYFIGAVAVFAFLLLLIENTAYFSRYAVPIKIINLSILTVFISDVLLRIIISKDKKEHLKYNWFDLIVFVPLVQFIRGIEHIPFSVIVWQIVIITMLISRTRKAQKLLTLLHLKPAQLMIISFSFTVGFGAILLMLPAATVSGARTSLVDALFTATSATCVTGLVVRDTGTYFSIFGQSVILALIQLGGLGIMTFSISLALILGKHVDIKQQAAMQDILDQETISSARNLTAFIVKMTLLIEFAGAVLLFFAWKNRFPDALVTGYYALFHSVSAFCNAGFSTFSDSLTRFGTDTVTNITISVLIISGGIGFPVIKNFYDKIVNRITRNSRKAIRLKVQTKIVLLMSFLLILIGSISIYFFEKTNSFAGTGQYGSWVLSFFQSVTARTAGFNSCSIGGMSAASLFIIILLMFIGASPASTGGGIKTTTVFVLWATIVSSFRNRNNVEAYKRTIPAIVIQKAVSLLAVSISVVAVFTVLLLYFEKKLFLDILFETVSAFGTVGLSTGITPDLSRKGKILITILMFIGRMGPLMIGYAVLSHKRPPKYFYAEERVMIG